MTKLFHYVVAALAIISMPMLSSCSDDKDEPNAGTGDKVDVASVFPEGHFMPSGVTNITTDANGLVTGITTDDGKDVKFEYFGVTSRAGEPYVLMTILENDDWGWVKYELKMTLNSMGYVKHCVERIKDSDGENEREEWWFKYNSAGQLTYMKRTEGDNEVTNIKYSGGDIVSVKMKSEDDDEIETNATIAYTNSSVLTPIENKGGIMLFDDCFAIDMDEMSYAYLAGLLGKATKHLPVMLSDRYEGVTETTKFYWTLNDRGLPTMLESEFDGYKYVEAIFTWE